MTKLRLFAALFLCACLALPAQAQGEREIIDAFNARMKTVSGEADQAGRLEMVAQTMRETMAVAEIVQQVVGADLGVFSADQRRELARVMVFKMAGDVLLSAGGYGVQIELRGQPSGRGGRISIPVVISPLRSDMDGLPAELLMAPDSKGEMKIQDISIGGVSAVAEQRREFEALMGDYGSDPAFVVQVMSDVVEGYLEPMVVARPE